MPDAAIALGSNLGDREKNLQAAIASLGMAGQVIAVSSFHDTAAVGFEDQPRFLNGVILLTTVLAPEELMQKLLEIEQSLGRVREGVQPKGPRLIDLDLIFYEDLSLSMPGLDLPHPEMQHRAFVLEPLAEVAPIWTHPLLGLSTLELLSALHLRASR